MDHEDVILIRQTQHGDHAAFNELVRRHDRRILQMAYHMVGNVVDAQDIYQETFLKAFENIHRFRFESSFATWLGRIAINQAINRRRQRKIRRWFNLEQQASYQPQKFAQGPYQSHLVEDQEFWQHLHLALDKLSSMQRAAFTLKHLQGFKITEIAEIMHCAEGTVKNHLFRATEKLKVSMRSFHKNK